MNINKIDSDIKKLREETAELNQQVIDFNIKILSIKELIENSSRELDELLDELLGEN